MSAAADMHFLEDLPIEVVVELGRAELTLGELMRLAPDDVVDLGRDANTPLEIRVGGKLFARGEVVLEDGRVSLRLLEVIGGHELGANR